ncbi:MULTISPECIES: virginiamycin B lyase family protein [Streptomyces]|uniref:Hydrolase n=1 Tax=Streptomyces glycanivorans TaxID=3033808 RepID=A0ABY9JRU2_9ACTN|nr:hydrolase [Streptomyces sp. Alt3]WLQ69299.1 hydrolase [Streptomyces sp. Alt3]
MLAAVLVATGCESSGSGSRTDARSTPSASPSPASAVIRLPPKARPADMVVSRDGTLWVAEPSLAAIAQIAPSGKVTQHPLPRDGGFAPSPSDLVPSPDGGIWYAAGDQLGHLSRSGHFTWWDDGTGKGNGPGEGPDVPGFPDALTLGPDNTVWYEHSAAGDKVFSRVDLKQGPRQITRLDTQFSVVSMTEGPDGAVWFTQSEEYDAKQPEGIGRLTPDGKYRKWPLPENSAPGALVTGPDRALWFTDCAGISRFDTDGDLTRYPVRNATYLGDIAVGTDKSLWFTTGQRIGRITLQGRMTLWPVPDAEDLGALVPAEDGSFWLADRKADVVRRFTPPR